MADIGIYNWRAFNFFAYKTIKGIGVEECKKIELL